MLPGNLIFVINELKHDLFRREKNDLHLTFDISLKDALLGKIFNFLYNLINNINYNRLWKTNRTFR